MCCYMKTWLKLSFSKKIVNICCFEALISVSAWIATGYLEIRYFSVSSGSMNPVASTIFFLVFKKKNCGQKNKNHSLLYWENYFSFKDKYKKVYNRLLSLCNFLGQRNLTFFFFYAKVCSEGGVINHVRMTRGTSSIICQENVKYLGYLSVTSTLILKPLVWSSSEASRFV